MPSAALSRPEAHANGDEPMPESEITPERNRSLLRTYTFRGPRDMVRPTFGHTPARWYSVWDQFRQEDVGEPVRDLTLAEGKAQALNQAEF
jgi:hypothetical protein